jgi:hypothetical protein
MAAHEADRFADINKNTLAHFNSEKYIILKFGSIKQKKTLY